MLGEGRVRGVKQGTVTEKDYGENLVSYILRVSKIQNKLGFTGKGR